MMNQGENTETVTTLDRSSIEKHQIVDPHQAHTPSYHSPKCAAVSWSTPGENHSSKGNGILSDSNYISSQQVELTLRNVQDGMNAVSGASTSNSGAAVTTQGYSGYAAYPNTDSYGYTSTGYAAYYNGYQQQPNQYQQQPYQYQQQSSQYPQQYSQYQQQSNLYQQQSNQSYAQHVGAYQNTGAQYEPLSSFQNTGSYAGPASYSSTYYNPGDYQTSGSYTSGTYASQTNLWQGQPYTAYNYPNYTPDSNSSYSSTTTVATNHYQQHYKQWEDYYSQSQTEVSCAPGTEKLSIPGASSLSSSIPNANSGYTASNNQMPVAYTPSWRPESGSSELTSVQPVVASGSTAESYRKHGDLVIQNELRNSLQPQDSNTMGTVPMYESFQNKQNSTFSQDATTWYPSHQVSQSHHASSQPVSQPLEPLDARRVNKVQIPNNPRIASNLPLSIPKAEKDNSTIGAAAEQPAYIGVSMQKPNENVLTHDAADSMLKPGMFPKSLRGYVERALSRCKDDRQIAACQVLMKELITKATADGTLYTKDWDTEPIHSLNCDAVNKEAAQFPILTSEMPGSKRSPTRRAKSRWEPILAVNLVENSGKRSNKTPKYGGWNKQFTDRKIENKEDNLGNQFSSADSKVFSKNATRPAKRQRLGDDLHAVEDADDSSDSDVEQSLTKYSAAAVALADSSEEKKRRENRSKRFEKKHGSRTEDTNFKANNVGSGNLYARRASALILSRNVEESGSGSRAVEDIDWDALTVKGTCQEIEKRYLRLTSAPDPATVRPEEVLERALLMVQNSQKNYLYKCDQLKSIRQDLTVQHIRNELTVKVYEMHARLSMEVGDLPEYNQCQSQLKALYAEGIRGCNMEFAAYNLLCVILHSNNNREILSAMSRLSDDARKDKAVNHALSVHAAVTSGNYVTFFRLYKTAPNISTFFMDLYVEKMRYAAVKCMCRSYRPTVPISYLAQILGFTNASPTTEASDDKEVDGVEECADWLKAHGACLTSDNSGEVLLDTKASVSSLYMPEPDDAVAHGDASLAVNDFLTRNLA